MPPNNNNLTSVLSRQMQRLRQKVDRTDLKMLQLLQQRTKLIGEIGRMKRRHRAVIYVPERERELVARLVRLSKGKLSSRVVSAVYREILSGSRAAQGQPPIGLLEENSGGVLSAAQRAFGACDRFTARKTWPELAKGLRNRTLSFALVTGRDLVQALRTEPPWREFTKHLNVAGEISPAGEKTVSPIFIITPRGNGAAAKVNRIVILIECKSTLNAIKSLLRTMPELSLHAEPLRATPARRGLALAQLSAARTVDGAKAASLLAAAAKTAGLSLSILGAYLAPEDYGG
jgi:chorismate mutase